MFRNETDPLKSWKENENNYIRLGKIAPFILRIMPTSAPSDRLWSQFKFVLSKLTTSMEGELACVIMYMHKNQHILDRVNLDRLHDLEIKKRRKMYDIVYSEKLVFVLTNNQQKRGREKENQSREVSYP